MKTLAAVIILAASTCAAQEGLNFGTAINPPPHKPLQCPQYQHEEYIPFHCANTCDVEGYTCEAICLGVPASDTCVDDVHVVTEKQWVEMQGQLADLQETVLKLAKKDGVEMVTTPRSVDVIVLPKTQTSSEDKIHVVTEKEWQLMVNLNNDSVEAQDSSLQGLKALRLALASEKGIIDQQQKEIDALRTSVDDLKPKPFTVTADLLLNSREADWSRRGKGPWTGVCDLGWRFSDGREVHRFKSRNDSDDLFFMSSDLCFNVGRSDSK